MHFKNLVEGTHTPQYLALQVCINGVLMRSTGSMRNTRLTTTYDNYIQQREKRFECDLLVGVVHGFTTCEFTCMFEQLD